MLLSSCFTNQIPPTVLCISNCLVFFTKLSSFVSLHNRTLTTLILGLVYVGVSAAFAWRESERSARTVVLVSLVYLPLVLTVALVDPVVSLVLRS